MTDIAEIEEALERPAYIPEGMARRWLRFLLDRVRELEGGLKMPSPADVKPEYGGLPYDEWRQPRLARECARLAAEVARLTALLEKAPHGGSSPYHQCGLPFGEDCDCWKSRIGGE